MHIIATVKRDSPQEIYEESLAAINIKQLLVPRISFIILAMENGCTIAFVIKSLRAKMTSSIFELVRTDLFRKYTIHTRTLRDIAVIESIMFTMMYTMLE
jgi:hypothetical protein